MTEVTTILKSEFDKLKQHTRELRAALVDVQKCQDCQCKTCHAIADAVLSTHPEV